MRGRMHAMTREEAPSRELGRKERAAGVCTGKCGGIGACAASTAHELAESLGRAVDARDSRLFQHSEVVADLSSMSISRASRAKKWEARRGTSPSRSRRGGRLMVTTLSR